MMKAEYQQKLSDLVHQHYAGLSMRELFAHDEMRFDRYHLSLEGVLFDYSKNLINDEILQALVDLAESAKVSRRRDEMFSGVKINHTEGRAVLHTALRDFSNQPLVVDGEDIRAEVSRERKRVAALVDKVHSGEWRGFSGQTITDVVNIGIGGSDLGPKMVVEALRPYHLGKTKVHFVSNVDGDALVHVLNQVNPERTLFIVASKSFSTQETLMNAQSARKWLVAYYGDEKAVANHFVAVSSQLDAVEKFGIDLNHCYAMWDWVGGRYSLWSSIGMPIAFAVGNAHFERLLRGAYAMDQHFCAAPLRQNIPVLMAVLGVLYADYHQVQSQVILSYDERLRYFADYLQQADMESNGKSVQIDGKLSDVVTGIALWGGVGTNGQHAFHQLLHQGTIVIPADFIVAKNSYHDLDHHHQALLANCFAQSQAMMQGQTLEEVVIQLKAKGMSEAEIALLAPHKVVKGNKPSNTIVVDTLDPYRLGMLIAAYEHKIFVQGVIWNINSFDQWGVELGKVLGNPILKTLQQGQVAANAYDSSTVGLLRTVLG